MTARIEVAPYLALAMQTACHAVNKLGVEAARLKISDAIGRIGRQVETIKSYVGADLRLVVLPEYVLTGFPMGESIPLWRDKAALHPRGAEMDALAAVANKCDLFLCVNAYDVDENFPDLYFQSSLVLSPMGQVVMRYRRLISMFTPSPYDVWDQYLDRYGLDGVFPVADTVIGRLGAIASEEILYPEIARCQAMRGAEVFLHSTGEFASPRPTAKEIARLARASENMAYVVSANAAGLEGTDIPVQTTDGMSKLVDYRGNVIVEAALGETMAAYGEINIAALRGARRRPGLPNVMSRQPYALYAQAFAECAQANQPPNTLLSEGRAIVPERDWFRRRQMEVIERLDRTGVI